MFDGLYAAYVNSQFVRFVYGLGFFLSWAEWAKGSLTSPDPQATWLVFGWLPAVFWPIQAAAQWKVPYQDGLVDLWTRYPWEMYRYYWVGAAVVLVLFVRSDIRAIFEWAKKKVQKLLNWDETAIQEKGDEAKEGATAPAAAKS